MPSAFLFFKKNVCVFIFERESECTQECVCVGGEEQRERETQYLKQVPGSELSVQSPTQGSKSQTVRS